jgi:RNA 3'-terminal phosphate cyclase (ATP)
MIEIDGSSGEGGGQILRTSLALSLVTGQPFRLRKVRANRQRPGLQRQHLAAVEAAQRVGNGDVEGAHLGSSELTFKPGKVLPGDYEFPVGTAGSSTLVLQTILPALLQLRERSTIRVQGGTHNPLAPPFEFLERSFLPLLEKMGAEVSANLERHGFYPAGGGKCSFDVKPATELKPLVLLNRGELVQTKATAVISRLPASVAQRELAVVKQKTGWTDLHVQQVTSAGPGNVLLLEAQFENVTELVAGFGERGLPAEKVAESAGNEMLSYLEADAPIGEYLADQLLLPLALARGGTFRTLPLSSHTRTNIETIKKFLPVRIEVEEKGNSAVITVS